MTATIETPGVADNFWTTCNVCGGDVQVVDSHRQAHRCRIDLDAQKSQS
jgi:hypothetical protein